MRNDVISAHPGARVVPAGTSLILVWLILGAVAACRASEQVQLAPDYTAHNWQTEDGLPQNSVLDIVQTRDGYLWLGTYNGLVRFDGVRFTTFNLANSPAMGSDSVVCLFEDRQGRLWIGTDGRGITSYFQGQFTNYLVTNRVGATVVSAIAQDPAGVVWVGSDAGLFRLVSGELASYEPASVPGGFGAVHQLCCDGAGQLWIEAKGGLFVRRGEGVRRVGGYAGDTRLFAAPDGTVWSFNRGHGLVQWQGNQALPRTGLRVGAGAELPWRILVCRGGDIWLCSNDALTRVRGGRSKVYQLPARYGHALAVYEDREGTIWAGVNGGGVLRLRETLLQTLSTQDGLPGNDVVVALEERPGRVWVGGFGLGVGVWEDGRVEPLPGLPFGHGDVVSLARDLDGAIWVALRQDRLCCWAAGRLLHEEAAPQESAWTVFVSREGDLWVGSRLAGVEQRGRGNGPRIRYAPANGLSGAAVTAIAQDRDGAVWVGTKHGLNRIHLGRITRYYREQGLGTDSIHTLYVDHEGRLWVGTAGGGLALREGGRFVCFGARQGLANEVIAQIIEDDRGALWLGSNAGILRVDRNELLACARGQTATVHCRTFGRDEGMLNCECAGSFQPSCFRGQDGRLWFSTVGGMAILDPQRLTTNSLPPIVKVEAVTADGRPCPVFRDADGASRSRIPAGTVRIQVECAGLSFVAPENMRFQFRLDNLDAEWRDAGPRRVAYFNRLPPGEYGFRVRACNNDGTWNEVGAAIRLSAEAFWWQTRAFRWGATCGLAVLFAVAGWGLHRYRLRRALELSEKRGAEARASELGAANQTLQARTLELEHALANVKTLSGLIPICAGCKKIRDDRGFWEQVEMYVARHSKATFTHGLCPACLEEYFPGVCPTAAPPGTPAKPGPPVPPASSANPR